MSYSERARPRPALRRSLQNMDDGVTSRTVEAEFHQRTSTRSPEPRISSPEALIRPALPPPIDANNGSRQSSVRFRSDPLAISESIGRDYFSRRLSERIEKNYGPDEDDQPTRTLPVYQPAEDFRPTYRPANDFRDDTYIQQPQRYNYEYEPSYNRPRPLTPPLEESLPWESRTMALVSKRWEDRERDWGLRSRQRDSWFDRDDGWLRDWKDWPTDWPQPRDLVERFERNTDRWWKDWPADWPKMDVVMPRFSSHLDQMHSDWRTDPFWRDIYPRWAEPIFKEGIDVNAKIRNDDRGFGVDVDAYQFKPEELQVKTQGDTLLIEGKHEDVRDSDNFTKMHFIRRYQLPRDVDPREVTSSIDTSVCLKLKGGNFQQGRLTVEAPRRLNAIRGNERLIPVEGPSRIRSTSASPRTRHDSGYGRSDFSPRSNDRNTPLTVDPDSREHRYSGRESRERDYRDYTRELANRDYGTRDLNSRDYNSRNYDSRDYNTTQQQSYYRRAESRTSASPHDVTVVNENRQYNNGRNTPFEERPVDRRDERREERRDELFGTGPHRQANKSFFNSIRDKFERGFGRRERTERTERDYRQETPVAPREPREHDYRGSERRGYSTDRNGYNSDRDRVTDSRLGYRVDSPSSYAGSQRNGGLLTTAEPRSESRAESVHQVQILRREKRY